MIAELRQDDDDVYAWGGPMNALGRMGGETRLQHAVRTKELIVGLINRADETTIAWIQKHERMRRMEIALRYIIALTGVSTVPDLAQPYWRRAIAIAEKALQEGP